MSKLTKLPKSAPWHDEFAKVLNAEFDAIDAMFLSAAKKAFWLGVFLEFAKQQGKADGTIPHGQFGNFLKRVAPQISWRRVSEFMLISRNVCEKAKLQIGGYRQFALADHLPALLGDGEGLSGEVAKFKSKADDFLSGKTKNQLLMLDVKQVELDDDGELQIKVGRLDGEGGKRSLTLEEQVANEKQLAFDFTESVRKIFTDYGPKFMLNKDEDIMAEIAELDRQSAARKAWLKLPAAKRDPKEIEALLMDH